MAGGPKLVTVPIVVTDDSAHPRTVHCPRKDRLLDVEEACRGCAHNAHLSTTVDHEAGVVVCSLDDTQEEP
jgi:hypothetical protein